MAHDFNNILTVIQGHSMLLLATKPPESSDRKPCRQLRQRRNEPANSFGNCSLSAGSSCKDVPDGHW